MTSYPYIIQGSNIVVVINNQTHTVSKSHMTYNTVLEAIKAGDWDKVKESIEPKKAIIAYGKGNLSVQDGEVYWKGEVFSSYQTGKMVEMLESGFSIEPLANFTENVMKNPSRRAVYELYPFLEKGGMPITPDGHFLAYKKVNDNYFDVHSRTVLNKPYGLMVDNDLKWIAEGSAGKKKEVTVSIENGVTVVSMERNEVNDDKDQTCSEGLHFCSKEYLRSFGGDRTVILKINPADVVSIPSDYNNSKGRTCRYEVIGELNEETVLSPEKAFTAPVQDNAYGIKESINKLTPWPFAKATVAPVVTRQSAASNAAQEYDKKGNPLSMTKDAIRKRKARAAKNSVTPTPFYANAWPTPKGF